ncbi:hypothetical protein ACQEVB_37420 [Pseudonocardia sp. CA-107938]|uniref:hypothetical protein n=1 Tax=Pseudonocardia sp. CA-107938 TaxID=3240021 RepID=UPI003D945CEE
MDNPVGRWALTAVSQDEPRLRVDWDVEFPDGQPGIARFGEVTLPLDELLHRWLAGAEFRPVPVPAPASGLVLRIAEDTAFTESGSADVPWFDVDGVLEASAVPFAGTVTRAGYLVADGVEPRPVDGRPEVLCRVDDGDTRITDAVLADADSLVRTVSVVTDELYPSRIRYRYERI